jgi:hydrogenase 3 maturation protease
MLNLSWQDSLRQKLANLKHRPRLAFLGVGNDLYGDDAAGVVAARRLQAGLGGRKDILIMDAGGVPENCTGPLRRFKPDAVLLIDAAQMNADAGTIRFLSWHDVVGLQTSTHTFPLHILAQYLSDELGCHVFLIGIQPGSAVFDTPLSPPAQAAVDELVASLTDILN